MRVQGSEERGRGEVNEDDTGRNRKEKEKKSGYRIWERIGVRGW